MNCRYVELCKHLFGVLWVFTGFFVVDTVELTGSVRDAYVFRTCSAPIDTIRRVWYICNGQQEYAQVDLKISGKIGILGEMGYHILKLSILPKICVRMDHLG